jgi:hypothetical protein
MPLYYVAGELGFLCIHAGNRYWSANVKYTEVFNNWTAADNAARSMGAHTWAILQVAHAA